jgi:hypothetical protein
MFRIKHINRFSVLTLLLWASLAQAALHDRGNGLIYDDILDVTWLQDANLAATETFGVSGIRPDGSFAGCNTPRRWIEAMNAANYKGFSDWQFPRPEPVNGVDWNEQFSYDGSTDAGYNISAPGSAYPGSHAHPLAHLFYQSLGNQGWYDVNGDRNTQGCPDDTNGCLRNTGPFINLLPAQYLPRPSCLTITGVSLASQFSFRTGSVRTDAASWVHVLPYRPGDVPGARSVPVLSPWLLGALGGLLLMLGGYRLRGRIFQ